MKYNKVIGIVGGMGPYADLDLARKILDQTVARCDQDHVSIALLSAPQEIGDRTSFLLGHTNVNPAYAIYKMIQKLKEIGVSVVGIPCNTAHASKIFDVVLEEINKANSDIKLIHMIKEVEKYIRKNYPKSRNIGVLCTTGAYKTKIYSDILEPEGFKIIVSNIDVQEALVHKAIYDPKHGIKAQSNPVTEIAKMKLFKAIGHLQKEGAEVIVLGCTEITLAITDRKIRKLKIIDPTLILARALIRKVNQNKLKKHIK